MIERIIFAYILYINLIYFLLRFQFFILLTKFFLSLFNKQDKLDFKLDSVFNTKRRLPRHQFQWQKLSTLIPTPTENPRVAIYGIPRRTSKVDGNYSQ